MDAYMIIAAAYIVINVIVFALYGVDKAKAKAGAWRIPEATLIGAAVFGALGAAAGMRIFHHKTQKPKFKIVYVLAIIHAVVIIYCISTGALN